MVTLVAPLTPPPLPKAPPKTITMSGGGGQAMVRPVSHGNPPKLESKPIMLASTAPPKIAPKLTAEPTINVQSDLHMEKTTSLNIGMAKRAGNRGLARRWRGCGPGGGYGRWSGFGVRGVILGAGSSRLAVASRNRR